MINVPNDALIIHPEHVMAQVRAAVQHERFDQSIKDHNFDNRLVSNMKNNFSPNSLELSPSEIYL